MISLYSVKLRNVWDPIVRELFRSTDTQEFLLEKIVEYKVEVESYAALKDEEIGKFAERWDIPVDSIDVLYLLREASRKKLEIENVELEVDQEEVPRVPQEVHDDGTVRTTMLPEFRPASLWTINDVKWALCEFFLENPGKWFSCKEIAKEFAVILRIEQVTKSFFFTIFNHLNNFHVRESVLEKKPKSTYRLAESEEAKTKMEEFLKRRSVSRTSAHIDLSWNYSEGKRELRYKEIIVKYVKHKREEMESSGAYYPSLFLFSEMDVFDWAFGKGFRPSLTINTIQLSLNDLCPEVLEKFKKEFVVVDWDFEKHLWGKPWIGEMMKNAVKEFVLSKANELGETNKEHFKFTSRNAFDWAKEKNPDSDMFRPSRFSAFSLSVSELARDEGLLKCASRRGGGGRGNPNVYKVEKWDVDSWESTKKKRKRMEMIEDVPSERERKKAKVLSTEAEIDFLLD